MKFEPKLVAILSAKITFALLIISLMILWIIVAVQNVNDTHMAEADHRRYNRNPQDMIDARIFSRIRAVTIFNAILEEIIALLAIIGIFKTYKYLFNTSILLLTIIWFVSHFRILEFFWQGRGTLISAHIIHFFVWVIGLALSYIIDTDVGRSVKIFSLNGSTS